MALVHQNYDYQVYTTTDDIGCLSAFPAFLGAIAPLGKEKGFLGSLFDQAVLPDQLKFDVKNIFHKKQSQKKDIELPALNLPDESLTLDPRHFVKYLNGEAQELGQDELIYSAIQKISRYLDEICLTEEPEMIRGQLRSGLHFRKGTASKRMCHSIPIPSASIDKHKNLIDNGGSGCMEIAYSTRKKNLRDPYTIAEWVKYVPTKHSLDNPKNDHGFYHFKNVVTCKSKVSCPYCTPTEQDVIISDIEKQVILNLARGFSYAMATFTIPHFWNKRIRLLDGDPGFELLFLKTGLRVLKHDRHFRNFCRNNGFWFGRSVFEITYDNLFYAYNMSNPADRPSGSHPHSHQIMFFKRVPDPLKLAWIKHKLTGFWLKAIQFLLKDDKKFQSREKIMRERAFELRMYVDPDTDEKKKSHKERITAIKNLWENNKFPLPGVLKYHLDEIYHERGIDGHWKGFEDHFIEQLAGVASISGYCGTGSSSIHGSLASEMAKGLSKKGRLDRRLSNIFVLTLQGAIIHDLKLSGWEKVDEYILKVHLSVVGLHFTECDKEWKKIKSTGVIPNLDNEEFLTEFEKSEAFQNVVSDLGPMELQGDSVILEPIKLGEDVFYAIRNYGKKRFLKLCTKIQRMKLEALKQAEIDAYILEREAERGKKFTQEEIKILWEKGEFGRLLSAEEHKKVVDLALDVVCKRKKLSDIGFSDEYSELKIENSTEFVSRIPEHYLQSACWMPYVNRLDKHENRFEMEILSLLSNRIGRKKTHKLLTDCMAYKKISYEDFEKLFDLKERTERYKNFDKKTYLKKCIREMWVKTGSEVYKRACRVAAFSRPIRNEIIFEDNEEFIYEKRKIWRDYVRWYGILDEPEFEKAFKLANLKNSPEIDYYASEYHDLKTGPIETAERKAKYQELIDNYFKEKDAYWDARARKSRGENVEVPLYPPRAPAYLDTDHIVFEPKYSANDDKLIRAIFAYSRKKKAMYKRLDDLRAKIGGLLIVLGQIEWAEKAQLPLFELPKAG